MAINPITTSGPSITVSTAEELKQAFLNLSSAPGGGTILLEGDGGPYSLWMYNKGAGEPVVIKSAEPDAPAHFTGLYLREVDNVRVENVHFDSTADGQTTNDIYLHDADNVQIVDSTFQGEATGPAYTSDDKAASLGTVRSSDNFVFSGNTVQEYFSGIGLTDSTNVEITDNEFAMMQGDGIRGGGWVDVTISGNSFRDFYSSANSVNHPDMIQIWGANAYQLTENVTISDNIFDSGEGYGTQTIFIRNDRMRTEFVDDYKNITIENNLIYNGSLNGISLADIDGLRLVDNTLLWNKEATIVGTDGSTQAPKIIIRDTVSGVYAEGNIAASLIFPPDTISVDNHLLNYSDPNSPNYVGNHFVNAVNGGDVDLGDLRLLPESDWVGSGASFSQPMTKTLEGVDAVMRYSVEGSDIHAVTFDATMSLDTSGRLTDDQYDFRWEFSDGATMEGINVVREFPDAGKYGVTLSIFKDGVLQDAISRDATVASKDIFEIDFEGGVVDLSDADAIVDYSGDGLGTGRDGAGFQLDGADNRIIVHRDNGEINDLKAFGLTLDLRLDSASGTGDFLSFYKVMDAGITEDRAVQFSLQTDAGSFSVKTAAGAVDVGAWHTIGLAFDDDAGSLGIYVDGKLAAEGEAQGETGPRDQNLVFGEVFGRPSAQVTLDNIVMTKDAHDVGQLSVRDKPADPEPVDSSTDAPAAPPTPPEAPAPSEPDAPTAPPVSREDEPTTLPEAPAPSGPDDAGGEVPEAEGGSGGDRPISNVREDSQTFFSKIINMILKIFGLGSDDGGDETVPDETTSAAGDVRAVGSILDLIPVIGTHDDALPDDDEEEDFDIAA